jgi:DNA-binding XRE family transcriptional regulator
LNATAVECLRRFEKADTENISYDRHWLILKVSVRQVKAARALLGWSQDELAVRSAVSKPTIGRLEMADGMLGGYPATAEKIRSALEKAGIQFIHGKAPGVRLRQ